MVDSFKYIAGIVAVVLAMPLLAGCETSFETDLPAHDPVIAVNGLWAADSLWAVHISKTAPRGEIATSSELENAQVDIVQDGRVIETLEPYYFNEGTPYEQFSDLFTSRQMRPEAGTPYILRVSAPGLPPVQAAARAPASVPLEFVEIDTLWRDGNNVLVEISFSITDPPNVENNYLLSVSETVTYADTSRGPRIQPRFLYSSDPVLLGEDYDRVLSGGGEPYYRQALFSDETIDGQTHEFRIRTSLNLDREGRSETKAYITLASLSSDYYRYRVSRRPLDEDFDLQNPFAEPLQLYSNVEGGVGIFAGANVVRVSIEHESEQ